MELALVVMVGARFGHDDFTACAFVPARQSPYPAIRAAGRKLFVNTDDAIRVPPLGSPPKKDILENVVLNKIPLKFPTLPKGTSTGRLSSLRQITNTMDLAVDGGNLYVMKEKGVLSPLYLRPKAQRFGFNLHSTVSHGVGLPVGPVLRPFHVESEPHLAGLLGRHLKGMVASRSEETTIAAARLCAKAVAGRRGNQDSFQPIASKYPPTDQ